MWTVTDALVSRDLYHLHGMTQGLSRMVITYLGIYKHVNDRLPPVSILYSEYAGRLGAARASLDYQQHRQLYVRAADASLIHCQRRGQSMSDGREAGVRKAYLQRYKWHKCEGNRSPSDNFEDQMIIFMIRMFRSIRI